jgi:hypothetical protein
MPLLKGMLLSFSDPVLGLIPTVVVFQYNPADVTRTFTGPAPATGTEPGAGAARAAPRPAGEDYTIKLELDATDGLEVGGPLTTTLGIRPRLAAIEMLMQPVGNSLLGSLLSLGGASGTAIPAAKLPLVLFAWGPTRITPVQLKSLVIRETGFDDLLNPIHATADLGLTVLRKADLPQDEEFARAAADYYQGVREVAAVLAVPQVIEMGG